MPLIIICGPPCSGKTTRAYEIKEYLEKEHGSEVVIINEENQNLNKLNSYETYNQEKMTRSFLKSNVEKNLNPTTVVIFDSQNYIKGYRYELYCLARSCYTGSCVLYCDTPLEKCLKFAENSKDHLPAELIKDFYGRMEKPNAKNRWDYPLLDLRDTEKTPMETLEKYVFEKKIKDPVSTKREPHHDANFLQNLDSTVQLMINELDEKQKYSLTVKLGESSKSLVLPRTLTLIELKRLKQEFVKIVKQSPPKNIKEAGEMFFGFLESALERDSL